ncbi:phosphatidylinositol mannoside acyltransferase [soil metagenome]
MADPTVGAEVPAGNRGETRSSGVAYAPHRRDGARSRAHWAVRRARERSVVGGYRAASAALGRIPPRISVSVGRALFVGGYFAWPQKRRVILHNASHVLGLPAGDRRVRYLARRIYSTYAQFIVELMRLPNLPADEPLRLVRTETEVHDSFLELHQRLRGEGRGTIVVSAHIGSIDLLAGAYALHGVRTYGLADDSAYPELFDELNAQRRRWGIEIIPWRNMRRVFTALREQALLGLVVDWGYRPDGVPVRLFGEWTTLPVGPALLAAKTGAGVVPVVNRRLDDGTYAAHHYELIEVTDDSPASLQRATQQIADALEQMVAVAPEQWYTFKPVWPQTSDEKAELAARAAEMAADSQRPRRRQAVPETTDQLTGAPRHHEPTE